MRIIKLNAIESTNVYLKNIIKPDFPEDYTVVMANEQTKGKGQYNAQWVSEPYKNLTFSVLKKIDFLSANEQFNITMVVSLAVANVLDHLGLPDIMIKWPNDILSGSYKLCGILIENSLRGSCINNSIIGIGLNVNQTNFPKHISAGSIKQITGKEHGLQEILLLILDELEKYFNQIKVGDINTIREEYHEYLFRKDIMATFEEPNKPSFKGIILGVTKEGLLQVRKTNGVTVVYNLKQVRLHY